MKSFSALLRKSSTVLVSACTLAGFIGCSDAGGVKLPTVGGSATYIYAIDGPTSKIFEYPANANGAVASPTATIVPPSGFTSTSVATDTSGNIYVAGVDTNGNSTVLTYAKGANGAATPTRTLLGGSYFVYPASIFIDGSGKIYVLDEGISDASYGVSVSVYAAGANGSATPTRTITDTTDNTLFGYDLAVDTTGNVYVSAGDSNSHTGMIVEYASTANGTVTPTRTITSSDFFYGIAVDSNDNVYVADDNVTTDSNGAIQKFSATATGAATPSATITGSSTGLNFIGGLRLDGDDNIFLINETRVQNSYTVNVLAFTAGSTGNASPKTVMTSPSLDNPRAAIALY